VISLSDLLRIPTGTRAIFDTNIIVYWVTDHIRFGDNCKEAGKRVEEGEIHGVLPCVILNELLHRMMIAETIERGYALSPQDAVKKLKDTPSLIKELSVAWTVYDSLQTMGFDMIEDETGISHLTYHFSQEYGLMAKDAAIVAYAHKNKISDIITNDRDFQRVPWLTCWNP
jgi:predicted nucleic acid-binding protein